MLVRVGRRGEPTDTPAALIRACHDRLRFFTGLASRLATEPALTDTEVREAAERIVRYFTDTLPHHEADEDESVAPRLRGNSRELDEALDRIAQEHVAYAEHVGRIVSITSMLVERPRLRSEVEIELRTIADDLLGFFEAHMQAEEAIVVPALERLLDAGQQAVILGEMRTRRAARGSVPEADPKTGKHERKLS